MYCIHQGDYNVFTTEWTHGSHGTYGQATANSILVGAQLGKFLNFLHVTERVDLGNVHLIGHSLGAQASGNAGSKVSGLGRITGKHVIKKLGALRAHRSVFSSSSYSDP